MLLAEVSGGRGLKVPICYMVQFLSLKNVPNPSDTAEAWKGGGGEGRGQQRVSQKRKFVKKNLSLP